MGEKFELFGTDGRWVHELDRVNGDKMCNKDFIEEQSKVWKKV